MGRPAVPRLTCTIDGCDRPRRTYKSGICHTHYARQRRNGTTDRRTTEEIFWSRVEKTDDCWLWRGYVGPDGYPKFKTQEQPRNAHRVAYELAVGPIPPRLAIDHLCRVKICVNPDHLEAVTTGENTRRVPGHPIIANAAKTHCLRGHPLTPDNLLPAHLREGRRACRECQRIRQRNWRRAQT